MYNMGFFNDDDDRNDDDYYSDRWHIGDPIDYADGITDPMNWNPAPIDECTRETRDKLEKLKRDEYSDKAWYYYSYGKYDEALKYINLALFLDYNHSKNWNIKGLILGATHSYEESEKCFNKSLWLSSSTEVSDNKAKMLRNWAFFLLNSSKNMKNGLNMLEEALEKNSQAILTLPPKNTGENLEDYISQRDTIKYYINYEKRYWENLKTLHLYDKNELFTIAGRQFYMDAIFPTPGMTLKLVKEPYNEHDSDAIAVYAQDEKIGYVANSEYTICKLTSSASELHNKIPDTAIGSYVFTLERYADIQFLIGRIDKI